MLGRYILSFGGDVATRASTTSPIPVLDVVVKNELAVQIGLNIKHQKTDRVHFTNLAGDSRNLLKPIERQAVLAVIPEIVLGDPALSTFSYAQPSVFRIHIADKGLQDILGTEANRIQRACISGQLWKEKYDPTYDMLQCITKNPVVYAVVLSVLNDNRREEYHDRIKILAASMHGVYSRNALARGIANKVLALDAELRATGASSGVRQAAQSVIKRTKESFHPISEDELDTIFAGYQNGKVDKHKPEFSKYFSCVEELPTTLHERANPQYANEIRTYQLIEASSRIEQRRKIIRKANALMMERGNKQAASK